jgi:hypothetical protein
MHPIIQRVYRKPEGLRMVYCFASNIIRTALGFNGVTVYVANGIEKSVWAAIFPCDGDLYAACGRYPAPSVMWLDKEILFGADPFKLPEGALEGWMESAVVIQIDGDLGTVTTSVGGLGLEGEAIVTAYRLRVRPFERDAERVSPPVPPPLLDDSAPEPPPVTTVSSQEPPRKQVDLDRF